SIKYFKSGEVKTETTEKSADGSSVTTKNTINVDENGNQAVVSEVTEIDAEGKETTSTTTVTVEVDETSKPVLSEITADGKTAVIPDVVVSDGQIIPVTSIGDGAMKGNKKVTDVKLGKNITEIGAKAFYKDKKLKNFGLTGSIRTIEKKAFKGTATDAVFTISATSKKEFKRVKKLVIKAGASKNATFVYEKESK
ncbi:MAG: leucine-rich repeat domain-containing protein, partial [Lachnospiraceae bacterium]|nr:leucine-rich repeat domain-containing protein [Lachnospiraceae bacterium]